MNKHDKELIIKINQWLVDEHTTQVNRLKEVQKNGDSDKYVALVIQGRINELEDTLADLINDVFGIKQEINDVYGMETDEE